MSEGLLRILIHGQFFGGRLGGSYARAFEQLGHEVIKFPASERSEYLAPWLTNRVLRRLTINSLSARRLGSKKWNQEFIELESETDPDFVFILNGDFIMPETIRRIRDRGTPVFIFHADSPYSSNNARPEFIPAARESSCYFIWSRSLADRLRQDGVSPVEYFSFGWDSEVFPHVGYPKSEDKFENEIVFVGNWGPRREALLEPVSRNFDLTIWGNSYWNNRTKPFSRLVDDWQGDPLFGSDAAKTLAHSKISINIFRDQNLPDGMNMRTFEIPGSGGFCLAERSAGATEIFPENVSGAYFSGRDSLLGQIDRFLNAPKARKRIADRAHGVVAGNYRYKHHANRISKLATEISE